MNGRNVTKILVGLVFGVLLLPVALELSTPVDVMAKPRVNIRRGKVYYKKHCRVCHDGNTSGVVTLEPITKTMEQWSREFADGGTVEACHGRVQEKLDVTLAEQDLLDIQGYLVHHAADSDQPATCGN